MKILIGCLYFSNLTGSEIYYYEVAKVLAQRGHEVHVAADLIGGKITEMAKEKGIKVTHIDNIEDIDYDICIASHVPIIKTILTTKAASKNWKDTKIISINHHEFYDVEKPIVNKDICHYISIRPKITDILINYGIPKDKITLVWNPFDMAKFDKSKRTRKNIFNVNEYYKPYARVEPFKVLFCGLVDYLRKAPIYHVADITLKKGDQMVLLGDNRADYLQHLLDTHPNVTYVPESWNVEDYINSCDATAGVFVGRSTIEGWLCGIPGIVYEMNPDYSIANVKFYPVPDDITMFDENYCVDRILECAQI